MALTDPWSHYGARDREWDLGSVRKKNFMYEYHPGCYCARCKNKRQATSHKLQAKVASIKQLLTKLFYKII